MVKEHMLLGIHLARKASYHACSWIYRAVGKAPDRPWMLLEEVDIIRELLLRLRPMRCLEWGAGNSTLYFPRFLPEGAQWIAIEHVPDWANRVARSPKLSSKVTVLNVDVEAVHPCEAARTEEEVYREYVNAPKAMGPFDFILVDGRARNACVRASKELLSGGGIVALHDANRQKYRESTRSFPFQCDFLGRGQDQLGLWLGSLQRPIEDLLDVRRHRRIWEFCRSIGERNLPRVES